MHDPVIILAPPRSFTSVVCAMVGQHPQMYGLPEMNLFMADTVRELQEVLARPRFLEHGLLRAVAEICAGKQTFQTIALARQWLEIRGDCTAASMFRELAQQVSPRILVDKSITTVFGSGSLQRVLWAFPRTRFIHLIRHPRSVGESLSRMGGAVAAAFLGAIDYSTIPPVKDFQLVWYIAHMNIVTFLKDLPAAQKLQLRGEDLLADPDTYLKFMAAWLGLRTDERAIEAMKHPERSPYACLGPINALFGNDPGFLRAPALRRSAPAGPPTLEGPLDWRPDGKGFLPEVKELAHTFGYR